MKPTNYLFLLLFFVSVHYPIVHAQPPIYCKENMYPSAVHPGWYETYKCVYQSKILYTDSTYVSYLWSTGDTTDSTSVPYSTTTDTITLIVELTPGVFDTATLILNPPSTFTDPYHVWNADYLHCPGLSTFGVVVAYTDSLIKWSNGPWLTIPIMGPNCNTQVYDLPPGFLTDTVYATRISRTGCIYHANYYVPAHFPFVADISIPPVITDMGSYLQAAYAFEETTIGPVCPDYYEWMDASMTVVHTGKTFTPSASGTYYVRYVLCTPEAVESFSGDCVGTMTQEHCETVASLPFAYTAVSPFQMPSGITLSPNPAQGQFTLTGLAPDARLDLCNLQGQVICSYQPAATYSLNGVPAGTYLLRISEGRKTWVKRLIVE